MQMQASPSLGNIDVLSSTGRLKVPVPFSSSAVGNGAGMVSGSANDMIGDLFGSRAGGAKSTELFGIASSGFYNGNGTSAGTAYVSIALSSTTPSLYFLSSDPGLLLDPAWSHDISQRSWWTRGSIFQHHQHKQDLVLGRPYSWNSNISGSWSKELQYFRWF